MTRSLETFSAGDNIPKSSEGLASFRLISEAVHLFQQSNIDFSPTNSNLPSFMDMPPVFYPDGGGSAPLDVADSGLVNGGTNDGAGDGGNGAGDGAGGDGSGTDSTLDPTQTLEQLIASGKINASLAVRAAALLDENRQAVIAGLNFFNINGEAALSVVDKALGDAGAWLTKESVGDPSKLKISLATNPEDANFTINADGTITCNKLPIAGDTEIKISVPDSIYGLNDAERQTLQSFTDYLTQSLSTTDASGTTVSPVLDPALTTVLQPTETPAVNTDQPQPSPSDNQGGSSGGGGGTGGGGGSSGGGSGNPGGPGDSGAGNGNSGNPNDLNVPFNTTDTGASPISVPSDAYVIPQDTASQQWLKAVDATVNGNGLGPDRYTAVSGPGADGYGIGAYNATATSMANWIFGLTDAELDEIAEDEYDEEGASTSDTSKTGKDGKGGKGKTGTHQHRDRKHVFKRGTAARLKRLRDDLRAYEKEHGKEAGIMTADGHLTADGLKDFLAHRDKSETKDDDGLVKLLTDMTSASPDAKAAVEADLKNVADPAHPDQDTTFAAPLQELMADDQLKAYGEIYKQKNPQADLTNPQDLNKAAGILTLAMHLGHYPSDAEIATDADGIIKETVRALTPALPPTADGTTVPQISDQMNNGQIPHSQTAFRTKKGFELLDLSNPVDMVVAHVMSHEGSVTAKNPNDNDHGASVGIFQWNQGKGNPGGLGDLLLRMESEHPGSVPAVFIAAIHTDHQKDFLAMDLANGQYSDELDKVINNPAFAQVQIEIARAKVEACARIARELGLNSIGGVMLVTDMVNQMGQLSAERVALNAAKNYSTEAEKINGILQALHSASPGYSKYYDKYVEWVNHMNDEQWFNYAFPQ